TAQSSTYDLPAAIGARKSQTTEFWSVPHPATGLRLVSGSWPAQSRGSGEVPVALSSVVAEQFGLAVGDGFAVRSRLDGRRVRVVVAGVWAPRPSTGAAGGRPVAGWATDALVRRGHTGDASFSTWGPLLVSHGRFPQVGPSGTVEWRAVPDWGEATLSAVARVRERAAALSQDVAAAAAGREHSGAVQVSNPLPDLLARQVRGLVVFRSLVLVPAALVAAVALAGLLLTASLLAAARASEEDLLRSRGASPWQLVRPTALEATAVAVVGVVLGPWLASGVLSLAWHPVLPGVAGWVAAVVTGAICAVVLTLPSGVRAVRQWDARTGDAAGPSRRAMTVRAAVVLVVAGLGVVAADQLRRYGVSGAGGGVYGVDPLLVAAPAVVLLAGGLLAEVALVPLVRTVAASATYVRGLAFLVGSNAVSRDPARSLPVAVVVALAAGSATFAVEQVASQDAARAARAAYVVGGDVQVTVVPPVRRLGVADQWRALSGVSGVAQATAVYRSTDSLQQQQVQTLAVDLSQLDGTTLSPASSVSGLSPEVVDRLRTRPWRGGPVLPAGAAAHGVRVKVASSFGRVSQVTAVLAGPSGALYPAGGPARSGGAAAAPTRGHSRLRLVAAVISLDTVKACRSGRPPKNATVRMGSVSSGGRTLGVRSPRWLLPGKTSATGRQTSVGVSACPPGFGGGAEYVGNHPPDVGARTLVMLFGPPPHPVSAVPAVVTSTLADDLGVGVGDSVTENAFGLPLKLRVVGIRPDLTTVDRPDGAVLIDAAALVPHLLRAGLDLGPDQWWLRLTPGAAAPKVADQVAGLSGVAASVTTRTQVRHRLDDSSAAGGRGVAVALWVSAGVAVALTGLVLVGATVLRRPERRRRGAVLQILGGSGRLVLGVLGWEYLLTAVVGALGGAGVGTLVVWLMLGPLTLDATGAPIVPAASLVVPVVPLVVLLVVLLALPAVTALLVAGRDRDTDLTVVGREATP
ncbi:MAG: FtsX-like permease family protein, partial [Nocardioidaceae bacterium]